MSRTDAAFTGSIPELYERCLGPMFFAPYGEDIAARARAAGGSRVLEIAAGTGIVTRALAAGLPEAAIEATDLNDAMVAFAATRGTLPNVRWSTADALALPFADDSFDLAVCQFGVMFFPDRGQALREARRTPHGHGDPVAIERDLHAAGFTAVGHEVVTLRSRAPSARAAAVGICEGTPLRHEIVARDPQRLGEVVDAATRALEATFGSGAIDGSMRAFVFTAR
jgi:SAM-dependent methyltransferase